MTIYAGLETYRPVRMRAVQDSDYDTAVAETTQTTVGFASPAWFWSEAWQVGERQADEDVAAGRLTHYNSDEDFLASL